MKASTQTPRPYDFFALLGPTGSGKTRLSEDIAELFKKMDQDLEVVSVDSVTVFKKFNIGSAKPSEDLRTKIPHHLIDICKPEDSFTASDFISRAQTAIEDIHKRGKKPLLVGGSGFYFKALAMGMTKAPATDPKIENLMTERAEKEGVESLYEELKKIDPKAASRISIRDAYRIKRALAVYKQSGKTVTQFEKEHSEELQRKGLPFHFSGVCLDLPREELKSFMRDRILEMLEKGWLSEVNELVALGYHPKNCKAMGSIGYRQIYDFIQTKKNINPVGPDELKILQEEILKAHLQLAKSQKTFFKKTPHLKWLHPNEKRQEILDFFSKPPIFETSKF